MQYSSAKPKKEHTCEAILEKQTKLIDGTWYTAMVTAIKTGTDEYETQVRWYLAKWKDIAKARRSL